MTKQTTIWTLSNLPKKSVLTAVSRSERRDLEFYLQLNNNWILKSCLVRDIRLIETYNWLKELEIHLRNGLQTSPRLSCRLVPTGYGKLGAVKLSIERRPGETGFHFFGYTARWGNIQKTCDFAGLLSYIRLRRVILPSAVIFGSRRVVFASRVVGGEYNTTKAEGFNITIAEQ